MSDLIVKVCKIDEVKKHPNADKLSIYTIKGWECVAGLHEFNKNDLIIFIPPNSIIPGNLIKKFNLTYLKNNNIVRTVKLRQYFSQGLILPNFINAKENEDVAKQLGITKYEPKQNKNLGPIKKKKSCNENFKKYTDINNIKNFNTIFDENDVVIITEKIHGTNFRCGWVKKNNKGIINKIKNLFSKYEFIIGSHNVELNENSTNVYTKIAKKYNLKNRIPKDTIFYGEIYGAGVQDLNYGLDKDIDVVFFDIMYKNKYLPFAPISSLFKLADLPIVPILYVGFYSKDKVDEYTHGNSILSKTEQIREGCVIKTYSEYNSIGSNRKIFKSLNPEYLVTKNRTEYH